MLLAAVRVARPALSEREDWEVAGAERLGELRPAEGGGRVGGEAEKGSRWDSQGVV